MKKIFLAGACALIACVGSAFADTTGTSSTSATFGPNVLMTAIGAVPDLVDEPTLIAVCMTQDVNENVAGFGLRTTAVAIASAAVPDMTVLTFASHADGWALDSKTGAGDDPLDVGMSVPLLASALDSQTDAGVDLLDMVTDVPLLVSQISAGIGIFGLERMSFFVGNPNIGGALQAGDDLTRPSAGQVLT